MMKLQSRSKSICIVYLAFAHFTWCTAASRSCSKLHCFSVPSGYIAGDLYVFNLWAVEQTVLTAAYQLMVSSILQYSFLS